MTLIKYGVICEDEAQNDFLRIILAHFTSQELEFIKVNTHIKAENDDQVDRKFIKACNLSFIDKRYKVNIFFVCRDVDTHHENGFTSKYSKFDEGLKGQYRNKCVIMLPVQCIEHWLLYIKYHKDNPTSNKNYSLETKQREAVKQEIYGSNLSYKKKRSIIQELMKTADLTKLQNQSESFKRFHSEFTNVLKNLLT